VGARTVEKIVRLTETGPEGRVAIVWLVDSAGARIPTRSPVPGPAGAGRIFYQPGAALGRVPMSAAVRAVGAGGAYIPAFCDVVFMVEGNASMYLGLPAWPEEVIGEVVLAGREMGGARMHVTESGCGDTSWPTTQPRSSWARLYLSLPSDELPSAGAVGAVGAPPSPLVTGVVPSR